MTIKITPIGSCRIHNPLKKFISKSSKLELNIADIYGFTHTSAEALQQIQYLQGSYLPSKEILPILSSRLRFNKNNLNQKTPASDFYFVEISSAKTIMVDDEFVQMNYIHVYFSEFFLDINRSKKFLSLAATKNREELANFLQEIPCYKAYPKDKQELLARISVRHMTEEELKRDMLAISNTVKNVVFITHCNVKLPDMTAINSRENWIKSIEKIGKETGLKVYNPTHLMMVLGQSSSLQKNGLDSTHYTPLFEQQIFNDLHRLYLEPCFHGANELLKINETKNLSLDELSHIEALYNQGKLVVALQQLNNLIRKHPQCSSAKDLHARILFQLNDFERAIEIFNLLDKNQELSNDSRLFLIKSHFNLKHFQDVLNNADLLFEEEVQEPEIIKLSAMASEALGNSAKASIYWEQLYKFDHFKFEAASQLALLYEQTNDFDNAIKWINLALDLNPADVKLRTALNRMLATVADEKSLEILIEKISPFAEEEIIALARTALNHNFILSAAKSLQKALTLWPLNSQIKKMVAKVAQEWLKFITQAELRQDAHQQWLNHLKGLLLIQPRQNAAIKIRREYILAERNLLKTAYNASDYDKAITAGIHIFFLDPNFPGIPLLIGRCFYAKNNYAEALEWFIQATTLNNADEKSWVLRASAALKAHNIMEALLTIQQISAYFKPSAAWSPAIKNIINLVMRNSLKEVACLLQKDELEQAWQINEALIKDADSPFALKILKTRALILKKMSEQLKDAESPEIQIKLAQSLYEKDPNNIQALRIMAVTLMKQKKLEESLSYWEKLCILSPEIDSYKMQARKCIQSDLTV